MFINPGSVCQKNQAASLPTRQPARYHMHIEEAVEGQNEDDVRVEEAREGHNEDDVRVEEAREGHNERVSVSINSWFL